MTMKDWFEEEKVRISETSGVDPRNDVDLHYTFQWIENNVGPEGLVNEMQCKCGHWIIENIDEGQHIETHGCGDRSKEIIDCEHCGRVYEAEWKGMVLKEV